MQLCKHINLSDVEKFDKRDVKISVKLIRILMND